jgi:signal transduction histidine kinase
MSSSAIRHGRSRRFSPLIDLAVAGAAFGGTMLLLSHGFGGAGEAKRHLDLLGVLLAACASLPLLAWRRHPVGAFVATIIASATLMALGYPGGPPLGATIALYLVAATRDESRPWTRAITALVVGLFSVHIAAFALGHGTVPEVEFAIGALVWAVAWFAGERTRLRRERLAELEQRAVRAERETARERRLAVAEERARIARDLHDSAAHAINVIAVQAGAARLLRERDPARSERALRTIEDVARATVAEIDQIVHSLREPESSTNGVEPAPGLAALDTLIAQRTAAGLAVTLTTEGSPRPLAPAADRAAFRILQEALTNSARHGAGGADVALRFGPDALDLIIANPVRDGRGGRQNGGHGLVGMRERASLVGGELRADSSHGQFRVHAQIPYGAGVG